MGYMKKKRKKERKNTVVDCTRVIKGQ